MMMSDHLHMESTLWFTMTTSYKRYQTWSSCLQHWPHLITLEARYLYTLTTRYLMRLQKGVPLLLGITQVLSWQLLWSVIKPLGQWPHSHDLFIHFWLQISPIDLYGEFGKSERPWICSNDVNSKLIFIYSDPVRILVRFCIFFHSSPWGASICFSVPDC